MSEGLLAALDEHGVVPVVEIDRAEDAILLADALEAGGLPLAEITLRTPAALDAIARIARERPAILLGAGTVLRAEDARAAADAGASFLVSPGRTPALDDAARETGLPFIPGAATASEAMAALDAGHRLLKFFPAEAAGGAPAVAALAGPLRARGIRIMPTGGVRPEQLAAYRAIPEVAAVGGSWIAPRRAIAEGDADGIARRAREARELARR